MELEDQGVGLELGLKGSGVQEERGLAWVRMEARGHFL